MYAVFRRCDTDTVWFFFSFLGQVKVFRALYTFEPRTVSTSRFYSFENLIFVLSKITSVLLESVF